MNFAAFLFVHQQQLEHNYRHHQDDYYYDDKLP
jgi:hypothetical protein